MNQVPLIIAVAQYNKAMFSEERKYFAAQLRALEHRQKVFVYQKIFVRFASKEPVIGLRYAQMVLKWDIKECGR